MSPELADAIFTAVTTALSVAVAIASFRRSRCLSRYSIPRSLLIGAVSASFMELWLIVWWVNRKRIADEWDMWRRERSERDKVTT
ncbi:MAG: hypothetical protein JWQ70_584 [Aeromicrobium sp.]|jgi:hypothetical protein|nr:hypothetical protein [Aeromicrobium sp.]